MRFSNQPYFPRVQLPGLSDRIPLVRVVLHCRRGDQHCRSDSRTFNGNELWTIGIWIGTVVWSDVGFHYTLAVASIYRSSREGGSRVAPYEAKPGCH